MLEGRLNRHQAFVKKKMGNFGNTRYADNRPHGQVDPQYSGRFPTNGLEVFVMAGTSDKAKGTANKAAGKVKEAAGKATGSTKTEAKGKAQQAKGELQKGKGEAKDKLKK